MGAEFFITHGTHESAKAVFNDLKARAEYDYGHAGYTGTIAEKDDFVMIDAPEIMAAHQAGAKWSTITGMVESAYRDDERIDDKWGPAGCIQIGDTSWILFGWASC